MSATWRAAWVLVFAAIVAGAASSAYSATPDATTRPGKGQTDQKGKWPKLSTSEQADAVTELKTFADNAAKQLDRPLALIETQFFLFYSDLPSQEAQNWASLLDRMYARLADLFGV